MTDQTGSGNPGPMGGHGITVALIGAASAVMVGMINGKVWPFNGAEPAPVPTEAPGPGRLQPGPEILPLPQANNAPPSPVQTVRRFLDEVDPEFDPQVAVNRRLYVYNRCAQPLSIRVVYEKLDKAIDGLAERYTIEPAKIVSPQSDDGKPASTWRRYVFINARTADDAFRWSGKYPLTTEAGVMNFRSYALDVDSDGDYRVELDCDA